MISEDTLEAAVAKVQAIPYEQRRIIVYTGVHPHEGTTQLASFHEERWKEYGALVVAHPKDNTPHAIWERHRKKWGNQFALLDPAEAVDESRYQDAVAGKDRDKTVFVEFHGTSIGRDTFRKERILEITPTSKVKESICPQAFTEYYNFFPLEFLGGDYLDYNLPANRVLVEYYYVGDSFPLDYLLMYRFECAYLQSTERGHGKFGNIHPSYVLKQPKLNEEDITAFNLWHVKTFDKLLKHIASKIG